MESDLDGFFRENALRITSTDLYMVEVKQRKDENY